MSAGSSKFAAASMSALAAACAVGNALAPGGGTVAATGFAAGFAVEAVCENSTGAPNKTRATAVMARRRVAFDRAEVEVICGFVMASYLRRPPPPPPPPPPRDRLTLPDPRWLLLRAALLLGRLLAAPPKALPFRLEEP